MANQGRRITVAIGDERDYRREELRWALHETGAQVVVEAVTGAELVRLSLLHQPDLIIADPDVGTGSADDAVARLLAGVPGAHVICDETVARPPRNGHRFHVVRGLVPAHVAMTARSVTIDVVPSEGTAVVCVADPSFRTAVMAALGDERIATVEEVRGAAEAYRAVGDHTPDLLIMDLSLTGIGGWLYLMELSEEHPECHIIVTSPLGSTPLAVLEVGASAVVAERDIAGLRSAVRSALADRQVVVPAVAFGGTDGSVGRRIVNPPSS